MSEGNFGRIGEEMRRGKACGREKGEQILIFAF